MRYSYVRQRCTSKAGLIRFFCKPKVRGADRGSDVCAREQSNYIVSQSTTFAVRVWLVRLGEGQNLSEAYLLES